MNILLIEDEILTAEDLKDTILEVEPNVNSIKIVHSVKEAVSFLKTKPNIQLIFSDIQLGDGLSFEIFKQAAPHAPIIFCTAYDEYALNALTTYGIHYILKPFNESSIQEAFEKFHHLKSSFFTTDLNLSKAFEWFTASQNTKDQSLLIYHQDKVIPIKIHQIALFYIKNDVTHLITLDKKKYYINKSLEELQQIAGDRFYRANRQHLINKEAIQEVSHAQSRKVSILLNIDYDEDILVGKDKISDFLNWLKR